MYSPSSVSIDANSVYGAIKQQSRSGSQDHLAMSNPTGPHQAHLRRQLYQPNLPYQVNPYPAPPNVTYSNISQHFHHYSNGPQIQRQVRPMTMSLYNPQFNQSNVAPMQQANDDNLRTSSLVKNSSSSDSLVNMQTLLQENNTVRSSPNTARISPSFFPNSGYGRHSQNNIHSQSTSTSSSSENGRRVRTRYACVGENDSELSFEPNMLISNGMSFKKFTIL